MQGATFTYIKSTAGRNLFRPEDENSKKICKMMRKVNLTEKEFDFFSKLYEMKVMQDFSIEEKYKRFL